MSSVSENDPDCPESHRVLILNVCVAQSRHSLGSDFRAVDCTTISLITQLRSDRSWTLVKNHRNFLPVQFSRCIDIIIKDNIFLKHPRWWVRLIMGWPPGLSFLPGYVILNAVGKQCSLRWPELHWVLLKHFTVPSIIIEITYISSACAYSLFTHCLATTPAVSAALRIYFL